MQRLLDFPHLGISDLASDYFGMALQAMGEHWRRFCFPVKGLPFTLFRLVDLADEEFLEEYTKLQDQMISCGNCADLEFSTVILNFMTPGSQFHDPHVRLQIKQLKSFLIDLCVMAPISSDLVECYHGYTQNIVHRWRGSKPTDSVAQARVCWATITTAYSHFRKIVYDRYMDPGFLKRICKFGTTGCNQYSTRKRPRKKSLRKSSLSLQMMDSLIAYNQEFPKPRKLSGSLFGN